MAYPIHGLSLRDFLPNRLLQRFRPGLLIAFPFVLSAEPDIPKNILFNRDVRPMLSQSCFACHGPDLAGNKSDLRLDLPEEAFRPRDGVDGREITPIVPGNPEASEVWRRVSSRNEADVMPPVDALHQLSEEDKAIFQRWIEQGADYQPHWAYISPVKPAVPDLRKVSDPLHPVDAFILAELREHGIAPSIEADRPTLIRRLSLDLLGIPPSPEEVEAFLADEREDAYGALVDRLLASPHFGERMAVPYLDVVRFADTVGFHGDQRLNIFPYREYVIRAFNENKPYDTFVREQLAGDLLPEPGDEQLVATGFNRLNMMTREGGAQPKEYLAKYAADRVRAVSTAFLGSTMSCAECHDHKFDPFTAKDFYSMAAYFADVKQYGVYSDYNYTPEPELKGWDNDFPFPPEMEVLSTYLVDRQARLEASLMDLLGQRAAGLLSDDVSRDGLMQWTRTVSSFLDAYPEGWSTLDPGSMASSVETNLIRKEDASVLFGKPEDDGEKKRRNELTTFRFQPPSAPLATLRIEVLPDPSHGGNLFREGNVRVGMMVEWEVLRSGNEEPEPVPFSSGYANLMTENYSNGYYQPAFGRHFKSSRDHPGETTVLHYFLDTPVDLEEGDEMILKIHSNSIGRVRISSSPLGMVNPGESLLDGVREVFANPQNREEQARWYVRSQHTGDGTLPKLLRFHREIAECREGMAFTAITRSVEPRITRLLDRGDWQDEDGEIVDPSPPAFLLNGFSETSGARQGRLDLADWITAPDNPLTARTFVNRTWAQFFGTGLSGVLDDLGNQGEWPSHPELLDWLAVVFVESGWDIKALVRTMVTSSTYRQSSRQRPELAELDPGNRLLARQNARRLEAEFVRDNALAIAGLMNRDIGGPSVHPYQPDGYYASLNFPMREYQADLDDRQYRRGLYAHWQRTFLHPMLANFDAPGREECTAQRSLSNTPQQALTLLNDPTFVEAARVLAQTVLLDPSIDSVPETRIGRMFTLALARQPFEREAASLEGFFKDRMNHYEAAPEEAKALVSVGLAPLTDKVDFSELAAWTAVARVVLNLNETIVRY